MAMAIPATAPPFIPPLDGATTAGFEELSGIALLTWDDSEAVDVCQLVAEPEAFSVGQMTGLLERGSITN
jgi:hypothetical protein